MDVLDQLFTDIAYSIRFKTGSEDPILPIDFPSLIRSINGGGSTIDTVDLSELTPEIVNYEGYINIQDPNFNFKSIVSSNASTIDLSGGIN